MCFDLQFDRFGKIQHSRTACFELGSINSDTKTVQSESGNLEVKRNTDFRQLEDRFNRDCFGKPVKGQNVF